MYKYEDYMVCMRKSNKKKYLEHGSEKLSYYFKVKFTCNPSGRSVRHLSPVSAPWEGGGGTLYNGLYGEAPPKRGNFFRPQVYKRVGIFTTYR